MSTSACLISRYTVPRKFKGHGDLDHIGIHKNEVADGQLTRLNANSGKQHHRNEAGRDQNGLAKIQDR